MTTTTVDAPTGMGTAERRDLAAWWHMHVACSNPQCARPAVWVGVGTCGCRVFGCDPCKRLTDASIAQRAAEYDLACIRCRAVVPADFVTWEPL